MNNQLNLIFLACVLSLNQGCSQKQSQPNRTEEEQVAKMLKGFYTAYIIAFEDHLKARKPGRNSLSTKIDSIQDIYLSPQLHKYLKEVNAEGLVLDFDPFLGGQMVDIQMLEDMTFKKIEGDLYLVRYKFGNGYSTVKLRIVSENDNYKIAEAFFTGADGREYELTKNIK